MRKNSTGLLLVFALAMPGCKKENAAAGGADSREETVTRPSGLSVQVLRRGTGKEAKSGDKVKVHYVGTLTDGKKFDSSRDRNQPFEFRIGQGMVIAGWDEGVQGMQEGELRKLVVHPTLGNGGRHTGPIPANAERLKELHRQMMMHHPPGREALHLTLVVEVELLEVQ